MKEIFDIEDREFITSLIQENCDSLNNSPEYKIAKEKIGLFQENLLKLPKEISDFISEYEKYYNTMLDYQLCLIYYIGLDKGMHYNDLINKK